MDGQSKSVRSSEKAANHQRSISRQETFCRAPMPDERQCCMLCPQPPPKPVKPVTETSVGLHPIKVYPLNGLGLATAATSAAFLLHFEQRIRGARSLRVTDQPASPSSPELIILTTRRHLHARVGC